MESRPSEVTELEHEQGADIQGLRWGVGDIPQKDDFREKRYALKVPIYSNIQSGRLRLPSLPAAIAHLSKLCIFLPLFFPLTSSQRSSRTHTFYKFRYTNFNHRCSLHHFQLRYLLSATSKNDLYYIFDNSLRRWDSVARTSDQIFNFKQSRQIPWKGWMPSTLACSHNIAAVGGYSGEYA